MSCSPSTIFRGPLDAHPNHQRHRVGLRDHPAPELAGEGCVTRQSMLSMIYKMGMSAETSWRRLRGFRQLAKVIDGVTFNDGIEVIDDSRAAAA